jgi:uncharacterized protein
MHPYADPYLAGVGLGCVLVASFVLTGQGLGASGAFAEAVSAVAPVANPWLDGYRNDGPPQTACIVWEVAGIVLGGGLSAWLAGRFRFQVARGPSLTMTPRLVAALIGGMVMGFGAVLARGCTSGQALSGGALLSTGSWIFMLAAFAGGFAFAPFIRRLWS